MNYYILRLSSGTKIPYQSPFYNESKAKEYLKSKGIKESIVSVYDCPDKKSFDDLMK